MLNLILVPYELVHKLEESNKSTWEKEELIPKKDRSSSNKKKEGLNTSQ